MLGFGNGSLELTLEDPETVNTGLVARMVAVGSRIVLLPATAKDRFSLAVEGDVLLTGLDSERAYRLATGNAHVRQLRVGLEGSYPFITEYGELAPYLELGVRQDAGDGETGRGVEFGAGLRWAHPFLDLTGDIDVHGLLAHELEGVSDFSWSGSIRRDPNSRTNRGVTARLSSSLGAGRAGGVGEMWRRETTVASLLDDSTDAGVRIDAELGYASPVPNSSATGTPWVGVSLTERWRDYRFGYRLGFGRSLNMGVEGLVREGTEEGETSDAAVMFRLSVH